MSLLFAAIGATVTALVEVTLAPYIKVADVAPHPVLVGGVIWTIAAGIDRGITWAFVGGLVLDSLIGRPLGVSAFALLVSVGGAALIAQPFPRLRLVAPIIAVPLLSLVNSVLIMSLTAAARPGADFSDPLHAPAARGHLRHRDRHVRRPAGGDVPRSPRARRSGSTGDEAGANADARDRDERSRHRRFARDARESAVMSGYLGEGPGAGPSRLRFFVFGLAVILGAGALSARLFALQVGGGTTQYTTFAATNRNVLEPIPSTRGTGLRPPGRPLVKNVASYSVGFGRSTCRNPAARTWSARWPRSSTWTRPTSTWRSTRTPGSRYDTVRIAQDVDPVVAGFLSEAGSDLPGVQVVVETQRTYAQSRSVRPHPRLHRPDQRRGACGRPATSATCPTT